MKKYLLKRIILSLFSFVIVIGVVAYLLFNFMDRSSILANDPTYARKTYNEKEQYALTTYQAYGYLTYYEITDTDEFGNLSEEEQEAITLELRSDKTLADAMNNSFVKSYVEKMQKAGFEAKFYPAVTKRKRLMSDWKLFVIKDRSVLQRVGEFFKDMFTIETVNDVKDETLEDRYIRLEWDKRSNMPALVGSGTTHKYLIYFDDVFPFVHQNLIHFRLGKSYIVSPGEDVVEFVTDRVGDQDKTPQILPKDIDNPDAEPVESSYDFHTVTYSEKYDTAANRRIYPEGERYTKASIKYQSFTRLGVSFIIGIIATIAAYIIGIPIGIWMALRKDKFVDKLFNLYVIFIMAVPSLAYIYIFAIIGSKAFKLPMSFLQYGPLVMASYILPIISLSLPSIGGLMKWMRRFMVDQQNSDYVKFARSQGLSEGEIFSKHISRNAFIFLVHNVPADLLFAMVGALITERVYNVDGVGNLMTVAINRTDNSVIIGVTAIYTILTIISLIAGDLLLAKYDPRISLSGESN